MKRTNKLFVIFAVAMVLIATNVFAATEYWCGGEVTWNDYAIYANPALPDDNYLQPVGEGPSEVIGCIIVKDDGTIGTEEFLAYGEANCCYWEPEMAELGHTMEIVVQDGHLSGHIDPLNPNIGYGTWDGHVTWRGRFGVIREEFDCGGTFVAVFDDNAGVATFTLTGTWHEGAWIFIPAFPQMVIEVEKAN